MNEETVKQEIATEEKTFTQAELDSIVGERLKRERAKYEDYESIKEKANQYDEMVEAQKSELQKAIERGDALQKQLDIIKSANAIRETRLKVAEETGVPSHLLTGETEEECMEQAKAIAEFASPKNYPKVRDAGEVTYKGKPTAEQQFAEWLKNTF